MAASGAETQVRHEWHELLVGMKSTVEGLLATQSTNVWNMYGGLNRLRNDVARILNHRLKVTQEPYGSVLDYWNFVLGLRWLAPTLAPSIEQMNRLCQSSGDLSPGQTWVRQSLLNHSLSSQLTILVGSGAHLRSHYYEDAFLCQPEYFQALLICLGAVEQNKPALLAELNPTLLSTHRRRRQTTVKSTTKVSHVRSASLPINAIPTSWESSEDIMIRRTSTLDRLAPPCRSPKTDSVFHLSEEYALPSIESSPESAKDALRQVLGRSGEGTDIGDNFSFYSTEKHGDPLMNMETCQSTGFNKVTRRSSSSGVYGIRDSVHSTGHKGTKLRRSHSIQNHSRKSAEFLDHILNTDGDHRKGFPKDGVVNPLQSSTTSISQVKVTIESPDSQPTNKKRTFSQLQTSASLVVAKNGENSIDSGINSSPPPLQSVNLLSFVSKKPTHHRSVSDHGVPHKVVVDERPERMAHSPPADLSSSLPAHNRKPLGRVNLERRVSDLYFPQPTKGQSLLSFLSSQDFHTCAELDKENAHFSISEALIAAIEQMKWNQVLRPQQASADDHEEGDSDEEIQALKQRIRIRRRECMKERARGFPAFGDNKTDPAVIASTTTPPSGLSHTSSSPIASTPPTESGSADSSGLDEDVHDTEITDTEVGINGTNLTTLHEGGLSLSLASLYSDADLQKPLPNPERVNEQSGSTLSDASVHHMSAESVAISLLKKFSEKQLPKASDLDWLVSEQEAPQALLPLPNSYPVSPDDNENADLTNKMTRLRGNLEWAPPRAQIIFNIHPPPKRKVLLARQNYCCAGCGAKVEPGYMKRYRYCEYLGKYFCPRCHTNSLAYIPGRILRKWDFTKYYVSNFACDLLNRRYSDPLFNIEDINPSLYRRVRILESVRECRVQLGHLKVFLQTCRNGQSMLQELEKVSTHWTEDIHMYSLSELVLVKKNELLPQMKWLVQDAVTHVQQCQLCQAKGFICEICNHDDIIFPFDLVAVVQCTNCRSCFHKTCFVPDSCPKCARLEARRQRLAAMVTQELSTDSSDDSDSTSIKTR